MENVVTFIFCLTSHLLRPGEADISGQMKRLK
jgi:hypothetical protein